MHSNKAFTLIEIVIALSVLVISLSAAIKTINQAIDNTINMQNRFIAALVASNKINEHIISSAWPKTDTTHGEESIANTKLYWEQQVIQTPNPYVRRVKVIVYDINKETSLAMLEGFLERRNQ